MNPQNPPSSIGSELLTRTRAIDSTTTQLLPLLDLLAESDSPSPLEGLRDTLIEILVAQRETSARLVAHVIALDGIV